MITFAVSGLKETTDYLDRAARGIEVNIAKAIAVSVAKLEEQFKKNLIANGGVDTGFLLNSIGSKVGIEEGTDHIVGTAGAYAAYAFAYEFGMPASEGDFYTPQFEQAIIEWAKRKGIEEFAWAIINIIRQNGTKPHPFVTPAWNDLRPQILDLIERAVRSATKGEGFENG